MELYKLCTANQKLTGHHFFCFVLFFYKCIFSFMLANYSKSNSKSLLHATKQTFFPVLPPIPSFPRQIRIRKRC